MILPYIVESLPLTEAYLGQGKQSCHKRQNRAPNSLSVRLLADITLMKSAKSPSKRLESLSSHVVWSISIHLVRASE
jgi:hypothetical protein